MNRLFADVDWSPAVCAIRDAEKIVLTTHQTPDGDGIGSELALYDALRSCGKQVHVHNRDGVPRIYRFLDGAEDVTQGDLPPEDIGADLLISLDSGSRKRLGLPEDFFATTCLLNIDHHASNTRFGDINMVDPRYCATGAMIYDLLLALDIPLSPASASALYTAILTDTASFRLPSTTASVYRLAADLVQAGAHPWNISMEVYESHSIQGVKLLGLALATLELDDGGRSAWIHVTQEMFDQSGADVEDTEGMIDYARSIHGVEVAVFIRNEDGGNSWKVSFRGKTSADVGALAARFGGGGHKHAAGCRMRGSFAEVRRQVKEAVSAMLSEAA